jgi:D-alanyl-D-alanine carboxypeptidase (penicillin-binding protein 5/6)
VNTRLVPAILLAAALAAPALAQEPLETPASHAVIMDYDTGDVLFSKNGEEPMYPASMTKIMTVQMLFERLADGSLALDDTFTVSENAWRKGGAASGGSTMFLQIGEQVTVDALLHGIIVQSGNDASIVIAEGLAGSEEAFADEMTARARELGLESANFKNSEGLPDPEHVISAQDLAELARIQVMGFPDYYPIYAIEEYTHNNIRQYNRNPLLGRIDGVDGLKTGHTEASGYGVVVSGMQDGQRRIVVLNGLESETQRAQESERLLRAAFNDFKRYRLFEEGAEAGGVEIAMGRSDRLAVRTTGPVDVTLHRSVRPEMTASIVYAAPVAPVAEGDEVARLVVEAPGYEPRSFPLVAASDVEKKGMFGRATDALVHLIRNTGDSETATEAPEAGAEG